MKELNEIVNNFFNAVDDMLGKSKIEVKGFGLIEVMFERDGVGNLRMIPVSGIAHDAPKPWNTL